MTLPPFTRIALARIRARRRPFTYTVRTQRGKLITGGTVKAVAAKARISPHSVHQLMNGSREVISGVRFVKAKATPAYIAA